MIEPAAVTSARSRWRAGIKDFNPVPYWSRTRVLVLALFGQFDEYVPPETNLPVFRAAFARSGNRDTMIVVLPREAPIRGVVARDDPRLGDREPVLWPGRAA
jgi:hypothetical protein